MLPKFLGKTFYKGTKKPVPVNLEPYRQTDASGRRVTQRPSDSKSKPLAPPSQVAKQIENALGCALVHLSPAVTTSIRIGFSSFTPQQIAENVEAVMDGMTDKFIPKGWRNIRAVHVKGPNTMALPIWLAEELWVEEGDVLEEEEAKEMKKVARQVGTQRPARELAKTETEDDVAGAKRKRDQGEANGQEGEREKKRKVQDADLSSEMKERRERLREQKKLARTDAEVKSNLKADRAVAQV